jgi:hypothetical protein
MAKGMLKCDMLDQCYCDTRVIKDSTATLALHTKQQWLNAWCA